MVQLTKETIDHNIELLESDQYADLKPVVNG